MISGPFFIGTLAGVGCGMMVLGPRVGTLLGTLEPMPMCARKAHVCYPPMVTAFAWDDADNAGRRRIRGIPVRGHRLPHRAWRSARHLGAPNPSRYTGQRIFVVRYEDYVYQVPFVEDEHRAFLRTIIPSRRPRRSTSVRSPTMKLDVDEKEVLESTRQRENSEKPALRSTLPR